MKPQAPDFLASLVPILLVAVCAPAAILAIGEDHILLRASVVGAVASFIPALSFTVWHYFPLRVWAFRIYYRFWGPICHTYVLASIPIDDSRSDNELVSGVVAAVRAVIPDMGPMYGITNRAVLTDNLRTITIDVVSADDEGAEEDWLSDEEEVEPADEAVPLIESRRVLMKFSGYEGKLTYVDTKLQKETALLLERISNSVKRSGDYPRFVVRASVEGRNPFFVFHLRDIPTSRMRGFGVSLVAGTGEDFVAVDASVDGINVLAASPTRLIDSARTYMASPILGSSQAGSSDSLPWAGRHRQSRLDSAQD